MRRALAALVFLSAVPAAAGEHANRPTVTVDQFITALDDTRNLGHAKLKKGRVEMVDHGPFGSEPWMKSGANAWVFKVHGDDGKAVAVRTFQRTDPTRAQRFAILQKFLAKKKSLRIVPFGYVDEGVRVQHAHGKAWEPALFLEWAEGVRIDHHVGALVEAGDRRALGKLAARWRTLLARLRAAQVAHGDLQHGNIYVDKSDFSLIDPDALYVPGLEAVPSLELGHRNFQHPEVIIGRKRTNGPQMDHFAGLVVYLSLRALEADPTLWSARATDEGLLLSEQDFHAPERSAMIARLRASSSMEVQTLTEALVTALGRPAAHTPHLDEVLPPVVKVTRARKPKLVSTPSGDGARLTRGIGPKTADVFADFAGR